ncbi:hypothetical protein [Ktedonospora formicarum]|uniref:hypothetical protein n=1 Tax=Ktedonospora formicarum TaxID=2778364 RepID=UPI001C6882B8|nr:hypothetical protein [Ktedonospora formicarum]
MIIHHVQRPGVLAAIEEQVHFARRRFGRYELIDFMAVLFGYAISGERTLEAFYERVQPWACPFMALFGREGLLSCSALSHFLAALDQIVMEALRTLFLADLLARPLTKEEQASCSTVKEIIPSSSMSMGRVRQRANGLYHRQPLPNGAYACSVLLVTLDESTGKWCARVPQSCRPIRISGLPHLEPWQRRVSGRVASGSHSHSTLSAGPSSPRRTRLAPLG